MTLIFTFLSAAYLSLSTWLHHKKKLNTAIYVTTISLFTAFFSAYLSHDSLNYQLLISLHGNSGWSALPNELLQKELFFLIGAKLVNNLDSFILFFLYAFLSFSLKWILFKQVSSTPFVTLATFLALYIIYFDGTIIRVSLGLAACYWASTLIVEEKPIHYVIAILLSTILFHYSLAIFLILPLIKSHRSIAIILTSYVLLMTLYYLNIEFGIAYVVKYYSNFEHSLPGGEQLKYYLQHSTLSDPYSISQTPLFLGSLLVYLRYKDKFNNFEVLMFNTFFVSFLIFAFLYHSQVIQGRFSELLRFSVIFITPYYYRLAIDILKNETLAKIAFGGFLAMYFFYYNYVQQIIADKNLTAIHKLIDQLQSFL